MKTMRPLAELSGRKIIVYDTEIKAIIGQNGVTWNDHAKMGISVACAYDYASGDFLVFLEDNLPELTRLLNEAEMVVAFNQIGFDNKLMRACGQPLKADNDLFNYDMLVESRKAIGWVEGSRSFPKGCKLDDHLEATFGTAFKKTSHGEEAPKMYQAGQMGRLISYCLADVAREKMLFEHIWLMGECSTMQNGVHQVVHPADRLALQPPQQRFFEPPVSEEVQKSS